MAIKYKWLAAKLREQLPDYAARGQHQLPTEAELASRYKVSRQTVRQALAQLTQEGLIEKRQGSGSFLTGRLRSFDQNIVSILISSDSDYTYPTFLYHLRQELQRKNFMLRVHITDNDIAKERSILSELLSDPSTHCRTGQKYTSQSQSGSVPHIAPKSMSYCFSPPQLPSAKQNCLCRGR